MQRKFWVVVPKSWYFTKCIYNLSVTIFYSNVLLGPSQLSNIQRENYTISFGTNGTSRNFYFIFYISYTPVSSLHSLIKIIIIVAFSRFYIFIFKSFFLSSLAFFFFYKLCRPDPTLFQSSLLPTITFTDFISIFSGISVICCSTNTAYFTFFLPVTFFLTLRILSIESTRKTRLKALFFT